MSAIPSSFPRPDPPLRERFTRRDLIFAASLLVGFVAISYFAIQIVSFLFQPLFLGSILALAFYPFFKWLHRSLRFSRDLAGLLVTLFVAFIVIVPTVSAVFSIVTEASALLERVRPTPATAWQDLAPERPPNLEQETEGGISRPARKVPPTEPSGDADQGKFGPLSETFQKDLITYLHENPRLNRILNSLGVTPESLAEQLSESLESISNFVFRIVGSAILALPRIVFNFLMAMLTMFFAFRDGSRFVRIVRDFIPLPEDTKDRVFRQFVDTTYAVIIGMVGTSLYQATVMTICFVIFGIPYAFLLGLAGFLVSILGLSPLVWVPASLYVMFIKEQFLAGIILFILFVVLVSTVDNFLRPYLISRHIRLHPLPLVIFIFGGLLKFGFVGLFVGPIVLALFLTSAELVREKWFPAETPAGASGAQT
ncbi:MAG: AI-2E family transporter [bacterium JZ-2024 1]